MNTTSNSYVMTFAVGMCVTVSTVLALLANGLRETQQAAAEFDRQKNVMMAAGLIQAGDARTREELEKVFEEKVTEVTVDVESVSTMTLPQTTELATLTPEPAITDAFSLNVRLFRSRSGPVVPNAAALVPATSESRHTTVEGLKSSEN